MRDESLFEMIDAVLRLTPSRWATSIVTSIVYGQHSTAEVDEYMKLMEDHNEIILGMPQPGGSILELFPFCETIVSYMDSG